MITTPRHHSIDSKVLPPPHGCAAVATSSDASSSSSSSTRIECICVNARLSLRLSGKRVHSTTYYYYIRVYPRCPQGFSLDKDFLLCQDFPQYQRSSDIAFTDTKISFIVCKIDKRMPPLYSMHCNQLWSNCANGDGYWFGDWVVAFLVVAVHIWCFAKGKTNKALCLSPDGALASSRPTYEHSR